MSCHILPGSRVATCGNTSPSRRSSPVDLVSPVSPIIGCFSDARGPRVSDFDLRLPKSASSCMAAYGGPEGPSRAEPVRCKLR